MSKRLLGAATIVMVALLFTFLSLGIARDGGQKYSCPENGTKTTQYRQQRGLPLPYVQQYVSASICTPSNGEENLLKPANLALDIAFWIVIVAVASKFIGARKGAK